MGLQEIGKKIKKQTTQAMQKAQSAAKPSQTPKRTGATAVAKKTGQAAGQKVQYYSNKNKGGARRTGTAVKNKVGAKVKANKNTPTPYQRQKTAQANVKMRQLNIPTMTKDYLKNPQKNPLDRRDLLSQIGGALQAAQNPADRFHGLKERSVTRSPMEQLRADAIAGRGAWASDLRVETKKSDKDKAKEIVENSKRYFRNKKIARQDLSEWDRRNMNAAQQRQVQEAKLRYKEAQKAGKKEDAARAHREAENLRGLHGYSGGAAGDQFVRPELSQGEYNALNSQGELAMRQARMARQRAVTEDEIARADQRIEAILRAPGYREGPATDADTSRGWSFGPEGRRMWAGTREQNAEDAQQSRAALQATGEGIVGGLAYAGQIANRANRDRYEAANMDQWIADVDDYISAQRDLEYYDNFVRQFGRAPDDMPNRNVLVMRLNRAIQARAQLERVQGDVDSLYFDPTMAEVLGLPTTRDETFGERMLRQAAEHQAEATEGMTGAERFLTDAMISTGQSLPGMALGTIPGIGPALGLGVLGAQAAGSRAYELTQQGLTAGEALRGGLISGGIEILTEKLPLEHFAKIVSGKSGRSAIKNILRQAGLEGTEEAVSYVGNYVADVAQNNPDAQFSWAELLENAGMGAVSGGIFGVGGSLIGEGRGRSAMPQIGDIQARTQEQAEVITQVQDLVSDERTQEARSLLEDTKAYNEMKQTGLYSQDELGMMRDALNERYAKLAGVEEVPQAVTEPAPRTLEEAAQQRTMDVQPELPPVQWERSKFPPSSLVGSLIDAARENNARNKAAEQLRADQAAFRAQQAQREAQAAQPQAQPAQTQTAERQAQPVGQARSMVQQNNQVQRDILARNVSAFGENGRKAIMEAYQGGDARTYRQAFAQVYDQAVSGKTQEQIARPRALTEPQFYAAVQSGMNDRAAARPAARVAGRNKNAGVDWRDQYVRQMDRRTAKMVDGVARVLGVRVIFADEGSILTGTGAQANAEIVGNVVRIEKNNPNPVKKLIGHELTHRMQDLSPETYQTFRDYVMSIPGAQNALEQTLALYESGTGGFTREAAMDELAADFAGELWDSSGKLQDFIRKNYTNRTLLERVRDAFRALAAKLTGREKVQADEAVRLLEDALGAASEAVKTMETADSAAALEDVFDANEIRHSLAGTGGQDNARLLRENQNLRDRVEYWKGQTKKSDRAKVETKEVKKLAQRLATDFSSAMDRAEIAGELQAIYDGLGKDWTYDQAYEAAHALAMNMVEQASESDGFLYNEYEPMRVFFRETPLVISPEIKRGITDYNDWRKAQMGRLRLQSGEQSNIDQVYQEVSQLWPEWFDEEREATSLDQLERIVEVMDGIYTQEENNPFQDDLEGPAGYLAAEIMDSFWDLPNVKKTWADRAEARLGREVTRRLDMQEKYQEKLRQVREDRDRKLKEQSAAYLGKTKARSQRQKERERRAQIMRHARDLSKKLLKPSDKQHIPQQLREAVAAVLDSVNLASKNFKETNRTKAFQELRLAYQDILQQGESLVIDPDLMDNISEVEAMRDTPIAEMDLSQLETIWRTIRAVEASITTANKAFGQQRFATIFEAADGLQQAMGNRKDRGDYRGAVGAFDKLLNSGMLTPESYFHRMGQTGQDIFRMLRNAQDRHIGIMQEAQEHTEKIVGKTKVRKWEKEVHTFDFDGENVQLTTAQIMSLYELMKRQQAVDHIVVGGIKPEGVDRGVKKKAPSEPYRLTIDQISEIVDSLTEEQVEMADALQKYMGGRLSQLGNEASMAVYGYEKFNEKNYFPIKVDKNQTVTDQTKEAQAATIAGRGFTKSTTPKANNALIVRNIFDVYADHVTDMATYSSWLEAMENLQRIYNFTFRDTEGNRTGTVKANLERAFGKNGLSYWEKLTEDLNNGVHGTNDNPFNSLIGNYKASAIGANIRVFIQQPTAILRALDDINPADFLAGLGRARPTTWAKVKKYAPIAVWKDWGYFDADTGRQMKSILFGDDSALAKVNNSLMAPAGAMDSLAWSHIWNALEAETRRTRKDLKPRTDEFYQAVAARFNAIIDHSQVVDGILQRSQVMRSPDALTKMATSFMAEPTKVYNMFTTAVYDLKHSQDPKARAQAMKVMGRTTFALIASFFANAAAQSMVDALRDDDKDENYWEKFFQAFYGLEGDEETTGAKIKNGILEGNLGAAFNPATYIPWMKDVVSLAQGFKVSRMDMDSISKFVQEIGSTWKAFHGDGKITLQNALARLTAEGARLLGIPASNIKRDVLAIYSTAMNSQKNYLGQFELQKWLYRMDNANNQTEFVKIAYAAQQAGDLDAYEKIKAELVDAMGQEKFDTKMKNLAKKAMETGGEQEEAFAGIYGTYETQMAGNPLYNEMPAEQRAKVEASLKQYAGDQVMQDASNGEITSADTEMAAIKEAEDAGIDPVTYKCFRAYYNGLASDKDANGEDIPGQTKQDKTIRAIEELELGKEKSSYLYHTCYSSDKNNPWA